MRRGFTNGAKNKKRNSPPGGGGSPPGGGGEAPPDTRQHLTYTCADDGDPDTRETNDNSSEKNRRALQPPVPAAVPRRATWARIEWMRSIWRCSRRRARRNANAQSRRAAAASTLHGGAACRRRAGHRKRSEARRCRKHEKVASAARKERKKSRLAPLAGNSCTPAPTGLRSTCVPLFHSAYGKLSAHVGRAFAMAGQDSSGGAHHGKLNSTRK
jgi:hypothetical protein